MTKKKEYSSPKIFIISTDTESLLTTFSLNGNIGGPAGAKKKDDDDFDWYINENSENKGYIRISSLWDDEI